MSDSWAGEIPRGSEVKLVAMKNSLSSNASRSWPRSAAAGPNAPSPGASQWPGSRCNAGWPAPAPTRRSNRLAKPPAIRSRTNAFLRPAPELMAPRFSRCFPTCMLCHLPVYPRLTHGMAGSTISQFNLGRAVEMDHERHETRENKGPDCGWPAPRNLIRPMTIPASPKLFPFVLFVFFVIPPAFPDNHFTGSTFQRLPSFHLPRHAPARPA